MEDIIEALDLYKCQHTRIGDDLGMTPSARGLSGGERKRLSIASELLTNPSVLLIDEPTSGLDSFTAIQLIKSLKHFAQSTQKNVVLSVHQPSSRMFQMFDTLLALSNGRTAYFGPANEMAGHMASLSLPIQPNYNPADFLLETLKYEEKVVVAGWKDNNNHHTQKLFEQIETYSATSNNPSSNSPSSSPTSSRRKKEKKNNQIPSSWATSFLTQVRILTRRNIQLALPREIKFMKF